jgi:hypothetical protein
MIKRAGNRAKYLPTIYSLSIIYHQSTHSIIRLTSKQQALNQAKIPIFPFILGILPVN